MLSYTLHRPETQRRPKGEIIMKPIYSGLLLCAALFISSISHAVSASGERNIDLLANGGPVSIRDAAKSIYNTGETDEQVLDALAEVLLQNYQKPGNTIIDALSWGCKALGASGNARYRNVLKEVEDKGSHRKLRKYASKSLDQLSDGDAKQYTKGTAPLDKYKNPPKKQTAAVKPAASGKTVPLSEIKVGMSMQEAYALAGHPTATTSHQTGKAWIPFNYKGGDSMRTIALYKGQGRIVFSNESHYSSGWRVLEVLLDENESGYP
jgi:hypothetical protein